MKILRVVLIILVFAGLPQKMSADEILEKSKDSKEYYTIVANIPGNGMNGTKSFFISKVDRNSKKAVFTVEMKIPEKSKMYYPLSNFASFDLIGDNILVVYDVAQKSQKNIFMRMIDGQTGSFSENIPVFSNELNSRFNLHEIVFKTIYSPDFSKVAILKDNISPKNNVDAEVSIYDVKTLKLISNRNLGQKYNGTKRVFDLTSPKMDNNGSIQLVFNSMNEETKMTTKSFNAILPFNSNEFQDIKEFSGTALAEGSSKTSHGRFYKSLKDYVNDNPIPGIRVKNGSYTYSIVKGNDFKLVDDAGNLKTEDAKNLASDLFTYKRSDSDDPFLMRIIDKKPYIVLVAGNLSYYALYSDNQMRYYTEGWDDTDLKSYKESRLKDYLEKYGLLEEYKKTMPKRERGDSVNGWFNKNVNHQIEYFIKLNKKMN